MGWALWEAVPDSTGSRLNSNEEGKRLWYSFTHMVLLDEQMRQHDDIAYCSLLGRLRMGDCISTVIPAGSGTKVNFVNTWTLLLLFSLHNPGNNWSIFSWRLIIQLTLPFILKNGHGDESPGSGHSFSRRKCLLS